MKTLMIYLGLLVWQWVTQHPVLPIPGGSPPCLKKYYIKIMVVGPILDNDRNLTGKMEDHLIGDLSAGGYSVIPSLAAYGPKSFERMTENETLNKTRYECRGRGDHYCVAG